MKKIKKIVSLAVILLLNFYTTCFADIVLFDRETGRELNGGGTLKPTVPESKPTNHILIGILVLVIVICAVIFIRKIIKKKREKDNK